MLFPTTSRPVNSPPALVLLLLLAAAATAGCSSSGSDRPPNQSKIGAACDGDAACGGAVCLTDKSFPGGYCYSDCKDHPDACPEGTSCSEYLGFSWCFAACTEDSDCRTDQGYHCEYQVCRPPCTNERPCRDEDTCRPAAYDQSTDVCQDVGAGCRCTPPCETDDDCPGGRCSYGECIPPCTADSDCVPGHGCDKSSGRCQPKPGKQMGEACKASSECATGYCLPARQICSIRCKGSAECPRGYVCGVEKLDRNLDETFDDVEADCVPVVGELAAGENCVKDDDCASGHCYNGFCLEACEADTDCPPTGQGQPMQCVETRLLVGGAIPTFRGCLPRQGTSHHYELGTVTGGGYLGLDIPANASSFIVNTVVSATSELGMVALLKDPNDVDLVDANQAIDPCQFFSQRNRYYPALEISSLFVPNTPAVKLVPGMHTMYVASTSATAEVKVLLSLKLGQATKGTLDINWYFLNLGGTCIPGSRLDAASAPDHAWFNKIRASMEQVFTGAKISIGKQTYHNINNPALDVITLNRAEASPELDMLMANSKGQSGPAINIYLVREINAGGYAGGIVLGIAGGIPGPPGIHGTTHSGAVLSVQTACFEPYGYNPGHTLAHEVGHYLGLFHNQEDFTNPGYNEIEHKIVCPCPCGDHMTCEKTYHGSWCRGLDHLPDTTTSHDNLMYFAAESTQDFSGNQLTPGQVRVMLDNPILGH